jgi:saccharopine dehydrogenase-like NADP-dependent oxidoreductase
MAVNGRRRVVIAGAGGIGSATAALLRGLGAYEGDIYLGDADAERAHTAAEEAKRVRAPGDVQAFSLPASGSSTEFDNVLKGADVLLDCLPGSEAPRMGRAALACGAHYANLTEYVAETEELLEMSKGASQAFVLQAGLAPGYVNVLAHSLYQDFRRLYGNDKVDEVRMRVGALTRLALAPHYYGWTWSPVGVATEYVKPAWAVRDFKLTEVPALTARELVLIDGVVYEEALTSGGAADLPQALAGRARQLDYKTLRYPGHYAWVDAQLRDLPEGPKRAAGLQQRMEAAIPHCEDDVVVIYASVRGLDQRGHMRQLDQALRVGPYRLEGLRLRAIQSTTAGALAQVALMLLGTVHRGPMSQSQIDPQAFLNGQIVKPIYAQRVE